VPRIVGAISVLAAQSIPTSLKSESTNQLTHYTVASVMAKCGCDLATVSQVMWHKDIEAPCSVHVSDYGGQAKYGARLELYTYFI